MYIPRRIVSIRAINPKIRTIKFDPNEACIYIYIKKPLFTDLGIFMESIKSIFNYCVDISIKDKDVVIKFRIKGEFDE